MAWISKNFFKKKMKGTKGGVLDNKTLSFLNKIGNTTFQGTKKLESALPMEEAVPESDLQFTRPLSANSLLALESV